MYRLEHQLFQLRLHCLHALVTAGDKHPGTLSLIVFFRVLCIEDAIRLVREIGTPDTMIARSAVEEERTVTTLRTVLTCNHIVTFADVDAFVAELAALARQHVHAILGRDQALGVVAILQDAAVENEVTVLHGPAQLM